MSRTWIKNPLAAFTATEQDAGGGIVIEDGVTAAFREGGGVPWSQLERIQEWQSELSYGYYHHALDAALGLAPGLVDRLRAGIDVLDAGCGHGHAALRIADAYPASRVTGYDRAPAAVIRKPRPRVLPRPSRS